MAEYLQRLLGGAKSAVSSATAVDNDFADFATAAAPQPPSHAASPAASPTGFDTAHLSSAGRPYTKWYRVWERTTIADFYQELVIIPCLLVVVLVNLLGSRANRARAKQWAATHLPLLESEFASIGHRGRSSLKDDEGTAVGKALAGSTDVPDDILKEKSKDVYTTYATGRLNVAFLDVKITLYPRYNPFKWFAELALSFFMDSMSAPAERLEATAYCFDGKERALVPQKTQNAAPLQTKDSQFDGFVWAVVHKDKMKQLRDDRYDISLTTTKDHPKLSVWTTVMSESHEVSEALLTPDLVKAINDAGDDFEALIVSDMPVDAPKKLNDLVPRKRVFLSTRLQTRPDSTALFAYFLRLPDQLVSTAHFRPEAMRKVRATREAEMAKIKKIDEEEKAEDRREKTDKLKKEERDRKLSGMNADQQKKFLEQERKRENKKAMGRKTMRA
ncbi:DUF1682-domain-containing protein [Teratosphaeria nubilosa]|uniref:DUF1682-domain-containing protein n=1 Tax=Teratosphaeria nubilosa TaxID=161662 RepID=A0A6G1LDI2_9PEZI|nr:DUF1682-domain-containing protein [Teratosphaeria nubilosa]